MINDKFINTFEKNFLSKSKSEIFLLNLKFVLQKYLIFVENIKFTNIVDNIQTINALIIINSFKLFKFKNMYSIDINVPKICPQ